MDSVIATGKIGEEIITVIVSKENDEFSITFNGKPDKTMNDILQLMIESAQSMDVYLSPPKDSLSAYYRVLETMFFEKLINIIVEGSLNNDLPEIEDDPNIIY